MKKKLIVMLLGIMVCGIGCSYEKGNIESENELFLINDSEQNMISINISEIQELGEAHVFYAESFLQNKLCEMSGNEFDILRVNEDTQNKKVEDVDYYISLDSRVSYISEDMISIVFEGLYNKKDAAHPVNWLFSLNYNPKTFERIMYSERYLIEETLYDTFAEHAKKSIIEECDSVWPETWGTFSDTLCSKMVFIEGMKREEEFGVYYTASGIVIYYPVAHSLGDFKEVEIPYELLGANVNLLPKENKL